MWWNDIKEIKDILLEMNGRIGHIEKTMLDMDYRTARDRIDFISVTEATGDISERIEQVYECIHDLTVDVKRDEQVKLAIKTLDKFDDYMKNVDKINVMINEMKGCISQARAAVQDKKELDDYKTNLLNKMEFAEKCLTSMVPKVAKILRSIQKQEKEWEKAKEEKKNEVQD